MDLPTITRVNIYRAGGEWCYAAWSGDEHGHSDTLPDCESEAGARDAIASLWPGAKISRFRDASLSTD